MLGALFTYLNHSTKDFEVYKHCEINLNTLQVSYFLYIYFFFQIQFASIVIEWCYKAAAPGVRTEDEVKYLAAQVCVVFIHDPVRNTSRVLHILAFGPVVLQQGCQTQFMHISCEPMKGHKLILIISIS